MGGVYLNRGIWLFWDYLDRELGIPVEKGKTAFLSYYKEYFSGKIQEEDFWNKFLGNIDLKTDWKELRIKLLDLFAPNEGVAHLYSQLRTRGYKLVLLSDQTNEWWPYLDSKYNISGSFDHLIISSKVGINKPDPEIYKYALKISDSLAEESIFIDDLENNLIPAKDLGIETILYTNPENLTKDLVERGVEGQMGRGKENRFC
ncbi:MAG: Acyl-CoA dehydrogenase family member 10 [Candidatus Collierbacteria bacterium GW2011_GWA2_44_99]|uniref:Acyl-CoA dehydrogenase family member 10 n=1 Tax=Candidatus Collierbacteria bacterium GW2011_GWA2_44_99 TaxID=1618380 RepID=A0A0G1NNS8_9BACT|nr:MAG: Acyl-CoA dehydrogenase family member 10 [Candidatus Collierbacteria bacterium GW2011_GWA2_44_99]